MSSFRILNQAPQYLLPNGQVNAGGKLYFYETDLTTPKDTWSDPDLTTLNSNPVVMDAAGRTSTDVWGDGEYGVVMTDADDVVIWTRNNVQAAGSASQEIPALINGRFLSNDGSTLLWADIIQVPDPTGLPNHYLTSDGTGTPIWTQIPEPPEPPEPDVVVGSGGLVITGDGGTYALVTGTGTGTNAGGRTQSVNITFPTPFTAPPSVYVTLTNAGNLSSAGNQPSPKISSLTTTGFTVLWTMGELDDTQTIYDFNAAVTFNYLALGLR